MFTHLYLDFHRQRQWDRLPGFWKMKKQSGKWNQTMMKVTRMEIKLPWERFGILGNWPTKWIGELNFAGFLELKILLALFCSSLSLVSCRSISRDSSFIVCLKFFWEVLQQAKTIKNGRTKQWAKQGGTIWKKNSLLYMMSASRRDDMSKKLPLSRRGEMGCYHTRLGKRKTPISNYHNNIVISSRVYLRKA